MRTQVDAKKRSNCALSKLQITVLEHGTGIQEEMFKTQIVRHCSRCSKRFLYLETADERFAVQALMARADFLTDFWQHESKCSWLNREMRVYEKNARD